MNIIKFTFIILAALLSPICRAQDGNNDLCKWVKARTANANTSNPEKVKMLISSTLGWGCDCPPFVAGDMGFASCNSLFLDLIPAMANVKIPARGDYNGNKQMPVGTTMERYLVTGHYTGKTKKYKSTDEPSQPKIPVTYDMQEFSVETIEAVGNKRVAPPFILFSERSRGSNEEIPEPVEVNPKAVLLDDLFSKDNKKREDALEKLEWKAAIMFGPDDTPLLPKVHKLLDSDARQIKMLGLQIAGYIHHESSLPIIKKYLSDKNQDIRQFAFFAVGKYNAPELIPTIIAAAKGDPSLLVRRRAVVALGNYLDRPEIRQLLISFLKDPVLSFDVDPILHRAGIAHQDN